MRYIVCILMVLIMAACDTVAPAKGLPFKYGNDCLPQAIVMTEALREKNIEADVLIINTEKWSHAATRYMYPKGQNRLYVWDHDWKSLRLRAWKDDPESVANAWLKATRSPDSLKNAEYIK